MKMNSSVGEIIRNVKDGNSRKEATETSSDRKWEDVQDDKPLLSTDITDRKRKFEGKQDDKNSRKKATKRNLKNEQDDEILSRAHKLADLRKKWKAKTPEERREIKRLRNRVKRHRKMLERQNNLQKEISPESQNATETDTVKKQKNTQDDDKPCKTVTDNDEPWKTVTDNDKPCKTETDDDKSCKTVTDADLERRREKKRLKNRRQRKLRLMQKYNLPKEMAIRSVSGALTEISPEAQKVTEADLKRKLGNVHDDKPFQKAAEANLERNRMNGQNDKPRQKATENELEKNQENGDDKPRRKATKADLERKREKSRLNQKLKRVKRKNKELLPESREVAIDYLNLWHSSRSQWSFKTKQQHWLLRHIFDPNNISEEEFIILLQYIVSLQGIAKTRLNEQSEKIISMEEQKVMNCTDEITKSTEETDDATKTTDDATKSTDETDAEKINATVVERARQVLQILV